MDVKTKYPEFVKNEIKLYTIDKENEATKVIGSYSYKSGNASDIDFMEALYRDKKQDVVKMFKSGIKRVTKAVHKAPKNYFVEVKLGLDHLYDVRIGTCSNNKFTADPDFFTLMNMYHAKHLIDDSEMNYICDLYEKTEPMDQKAFEKVSAIIRKHRILRWTHTEIARGNKLLKDFDGNVYKYTIEDGVNEISNINIEGITITKGNIYSDISNFFTIGCENEAGEIISVNMPSESTIDFIAFRNDNLKKSMYTLINSKIAKNMFKAAKRMLSFGISTKDEALVKKSYDIINTQLGILYQFLNQLKTIKKVIEIHGKKHLVKSTMYYQLDMLRYRLYDLITIDDSLISPLIDDIEYIISKDTECTQEFVINTLDEDAHKIMDYINEHTTELMKNVGLYPLPSYLQPLEKPF